MRRLAWASIRRNPGGVIATFLVMTAASVLVSIAVHFIAAAIFPSGFDAADAPRGTTGALISVGIVALLIGIGVPATLTISQVSSLSIRVGEREYASWRLAGASPRQVARVIRRRSTIVSVVSAVLGFVLSIPLIQPAADLLISGTTIGLDLTVRPGILPFAVSVAVVVTIAGLASIRPARRARVIEPIVLFQQQEVPERRHVARWVFASLALLGSAGLVVAVLTSPNVSTGSLSTIMLGFALIVAIAMLAPVVIPQTVRWLTGIVPGHAWPTWYLARYYAVSRLSASTATVTPLAVAATIIGVYFSALSTWALTDSGVAQNVTANAIQGITLFGPGAVLAGLASIITISIVGRDRAQYQATIRSAGANPRQITLAPVLEALIYSATAFLIAVVISTFTSLVFALSMSNNGSPFGLAVNFGAIALTGGIGFVGIVLAIGIPARRLATKAISDALRESNA